MTGSVQRSSSVFVPAVGKVVELGELDDYIWSTLHGWGSLPAHRILRKLVGPGDKAGGSQEQAAAQGANLRSEEHEIRLMEFADAQAGQRYPYLFALATVRLWAMVESAVREVLVECMKRAGDLPEVSIVEKLRGHVYPFVGATADEQSELLADILWESTDSPLRGIERYDFVLTRLGLVKQSPSVVVEIMRELSEVRHCVVHRGGRVDGKLLKACPWLQLTVRDSLPTTLERFWFYRTATYWYVINLSHRWARWRSHAPILEFAKNMESAVLDELNPSWRAEKQVSHTTRAEETPKADV